MGVMADPSELAATLRSLGVIDRVPTGLEEAAAKRRAGGRALSDIDPVQEFPAGVRVRAAVRP